MSTSKAIRGECKENSGKTVRARIVGHADTPITQASLTTFKYRIDRYASVDEAESDTGATSVIGETALTIASVIFDTLQPWDVDDAAHPGPDGLSGYNMAHALPASSFPEPGWYRIEYWADPVSGEDFLASLFFLECKATTR
jgi:hypothetical protein